MNGEPFTEINTLITQLGLFQENSRLLKQALAHRSYTHEAGGDSNERLEFLGDSVLSLVISEHLFNQHPEKPEGDLSKWRVIWSVPIVWRLAKTGAWPPLYWAWVKISRAVRKTVVLADAMEADRSDLPEYGWERVKTFILEQWQPLLALMEKHALPIDQNPLGAFTSEALFPYKLVKAGRITTAFIRWRFITKILTGQGGS